MDLNKAIARLCAKDCGFYGSEDSKNMCSKCYKEFLKSEVTAKNEAKALTVDKKLIPSAPSIASGSRSGETTPESSAFGSGGSGPREKNRCKNCNKKTGLTGFKCRCGDTFCGMHRYPTDHSCTFDFKKAGREILVKQNPLVHADQLVDRI